MNLFTATIAVLAFTARRVSAQSIASIVVASEVHQTLEAAVLAAPAAILELLSDETQSLTLFAPDDGAFAALVTIVGQAYLSDLLTAEWSQHLTCVLASHVVAGAVPSSAITGSTTATSLFGMELFLNNANGVISVNGSPVTIPDLGATNGIVHSISGFPILPPCVTQSIVDMGSADPNFSTLVSLVVTTGLSDALKNTRPLTLFAPTNAAFAALPGPVLDYLAGDVAALTEVLLYHVVSGNEFFGGNSMNTGSFATLQGEALIIGKDHRTNMLEINSSVDFVSFDTLASNGVIHVIDNVLIPPLLSLPGAAPSPSPGGKGGKKGKGSSGEKKSGEKKSGKKSGGKKSGGKKSSGKSSTKKGSTSTSTTSTQNSNSMPYKAMIRRKPTSSRLVWRDQQQDSKGNSVGSWMKTIFNGGKT